MPISWTRCRHIATVIVQAGRPMSTHEKIMEWPTRTRWRMSPKRFCRNWMISPDLTRLSTRQRSSASSATWRRWRSALGQRSCARSRGRCYIKRPSSSEREFQRLR
ncbi:unnamed protein product [Durusdinium trenchii]|uniref:Uncharacterized protein n=2 Tax=Durusdinium trenchii TaxID=1381693 RepID=A0ABP0NQS6_9DINO